MTVNSGRLQHYLDFTSKFVDPHDVRVWLPDNYSEKEKYEVLYMQDGQNLFDSKTTWNGQEWGVDETAAVLMSAQKTKKFIVVAISNIPDQRTREYFPQKPFESLPQQTQDSLYNMGSDGKKRLSGKINSDAYLKFIVEGVKPFIDMQYSVYTDKAHTFIAGSSMGGLISLYAVCEYPEVFGGAACLSTHWTGIFTTENNPIPKAFFQYLRKKLPNPKTHRFYFDHGDQTLDALYGPYQTDADAIGKKKGYKADHWQSKSFPGKDHSEQSWRERLDQPFLFLLGNSQI